MSRPKIRQTILKRIKTRVEHFIKHPTEKNLKQLAVLMTNEHLSVCDCELTKIYENDGQHYCPNCPFDFTTPDGIHCSLVGTVISTGVGKLSMCEMAIKMIELLSHISAYENKRERI